jgi:hypothetical protein
MINDMIHDMYQDVKAFSFKNTRNSKFSFVEMLVFLLRFVEDLKVKHYER